MGVVTSVIIIEQSESISDGVKVLAQFCKTSVSENESEG